LASDIAFLSVMQLPEQPR